MTLSDRNAIRLVKPVKDEQPIVVFTLKGDAQEYRLEFDGNMICDAESATGCNLMHLLAGAGEPSFTEARALLYALLKKAHPLVLATEAGALLTNYPVVLAAIALLMKEIREEDDNAEPPVAPPMPNTSPIVEPIPEQ